MDTSPHGSETLYQQVEARESANEMIVASFVGTLAFSRLALVCVFIACLAGTLQNGSFLSRLSVVLALVALGCAYWSQSLGTHGEEDQGVLWQIGSIASAALAVLMFLFGA